MTKVFLLWEGKPYTRLRLLEIFFSETGAFQYAHKHMENPPPELFIDMERNAGEWRWHGGYIQEWIVKEKD